MNDETPPVAPMSVPPPPAAPAADMFAQVDPQPASLGATGVPPRPLEPLAALPELEGEDRRKKLFVWLGVAVAVVVVAVGGWLAYAKWFANVGPAAAPEAPVNQATNSPGTVLPAVNPTGTPPAADDDFDHDGLTNTEEQRLETDPYNVDTDSDGLYDRDEVVVWHTDPLNPDTDGDSFLDGAEVANGYDPRGNGKLLQIPPQNP